VADNINSTEGVINMKFEIYRQRLASQAQGLFDEPKGDWRWRIRALNGRIVAEGGEGYKSAQAMVLTIRNYIIGPNQHDRTQLLKKALAKVGLDEFGKKEK